jgi:hypothetical protein
MNALRQRHCPTLSSSWLSASGVLTWCEDTPKSFRCGLVVLRRPAMARRAVLRKPSLPPLSGKVKHERKARSHRQGRQSAGWGGRRFEAHPISVPVAHHVGTKLAAIGERSAAQNAQENPRGMRRQLPQLVAPRHPHRQRSAPGLGIVAIARFAREEPGLFLPARPTVPRGRSVGNGEQPWPATSAKTAPVPKLTPLYWMKEIEECT